MSKKVPSSTKPTTAEQALRFLPVGLEVRAKNCVIVGGGEVATRKAATLTHAGARVTVVAPEVTRELAEQIASGHARWIKGRFHDKHVHGAFLVIAATNDSSLNTAVVEAAARRGALVCDASSAERSELIFGALLRTGTTTVAVFTDGRDPAEARRTRDRIAAWLDPQR